MRKRTLLSIFLLVAVVSAACNLTGLQPSPVPQQTGGDAIGTAVAQTLTAVIRPTLSLNTPTQTAGQPTAQPTVQPTQAPTSTPPPTLTPIVPSLTPIVPTSTPPPTLTPVPCDRASFVADVTVPDGTNFAPGATFVKTWRLKNNGSCTWTTAYALVFESGNAMDGPVEVALPGSVAPGQQVDLSVTLKAPGTAGTYQGYWKLRNASGARFGIGANATGSFWVKITVGNTATPGPTPTGTVVTTGQCQILETSPTYGSSFPKGASFDSRWKVKNISSSAWLTSEVDFKYLGGTAMYEGEGTFDLKQQVDPDKTIDLIVDSVAPSSAGLYTMTWGLVKSGTTLCSMSVTIRVTN